MKLCVGASSRRSGAMAQSRERRAPRHDPRARPARHPGRRRWIVPSMPNGKPGDHPLTDLLNWDSPAFGEPVDGLLREIGKLGGESILGRSPWREGLWDLWPRWGRSEAKDAEIAAMGGPPPPTPDTRHYRKGEREGAG